MMLQVENLDVFYGDAQALDGVSLEIEEGAIVAIVGADGAGETSSAELHTPWPPRRPSSTATQMAGPSGGTSRSPSASTKP